jgi:hypothetical protein
MKTSDNKLQMMRTESMWLKKPLYDKHLSLYYYLFELTREKRREILLPVFFIIINYLIVYAFKYV